MMIFYGILVIVVITMTFTGAGIVLWIMKDTEAKAFFTAFSIFLILFGISRIFYYIHDFFNPNVLYWQIAAIIGMISASCVLFAIEVKVFRKSKFLFTIISIVAIVLIVIPLPTEIHLIVQFWAIALIAPLIPLLYLYIAIKSTGEARIISILMTIGTTLFMVGNFFHGTAFQSLPLFPYLFSPLFMIVSISFILAGLLKQSKSSE